MEKTLILKLSFWMGLPLFQDHPKWHPRPIKLQDRLQSRGLPHQNSVDHRMSSLSLHHFKNVPPHIQSLQRTKQLHLPTPLRRSGRVLFVLCLMNLSYCNALLASRIVRPTHLSDGYVWLVVKVVCLMNFGLAGFVDPSRQRVFLADLVHPHLIS